MVKLSLISFNPLHSAPTVSCLENGTWFRHPESNQTWSNYTNCVDYDDLQVRRRRKGVGVDGLQKLMPGHAIPLQFRQFVNELYVKGYALSLLALLVSIIIFLGFK